MFGKGHIMEKYCTEGSKFSVRKYDVFTFLACNSPAPENNGDPETFGAPNTSSSTRLRKQNLL